MESDLGSIAAGKLADFAVLDAGTLALEATYVGGQVRYSRQDREAAYVCRGPDRAGYGLIHRKATPA